MEDLNKILQEAFDKWLSDSLKPYGLKYIAFVGETQAYNDETYEDNIDFVYFPIDDSGEKFYCFDTGAMVNSSNEPLDEDPPAEFLSREKELVDLESTLLYKYADAICSHIGLEYEELIVVKL